MKSKKELIPHLFRTEYSKIIGVLCKVFGVSNMQLVEDIVSDTFLVASETWGLKGVPDHPKAWLYQVAKNKAKDQFKRSNLFANKIKPDLESRSESGEMIDIDWSEQHIKDSQLQMIFVICNPLLSPEAQIGMALRILCGFGINEISEAFLTSKQTINKRLYRAKASLRNANVKIELPPSWEIEARLNIVLISLYLLFNEGYYSVTNNKTLSKELCWEAMRLVHLLIESPLTNKPNVNALMSLMCFHASRFDARMQEDSLVLYKDQDQSLWDTVLIKKGEYYLSRSASGINLSKYHLEAAIAYWHSRKLDNIKKWEEILQLYNQLLQIEYTPIAALNRTYALSKARSKEEAIVEILKIDLTNNHLYHMLLSHLYEEIDRLKTKEHLKIALNLAKSETDKQFIIKKMEGF